MDKEGVVRCASFNSLNTLLLFHESSGALHERPPVEERVLPGASDEVMVNWRFRAQEAEKMTDEDMGGIHSGVREQEGKRPHGPAVSPVVILAGRSEW